MKIKTINSTLAAKFDAFAESITDETVRNLVKKNTIITGGSIVSLLMREPVNDYDLYFRDQATTLAVAKYYIGKFKANPPPKFKDSMQHIEMGAGVFDDRVKIIIKSAGVAGEAQQNDYQYFEGIQNSAEQADAAESYVAGAMANVEKLDNEAAEKLEDKEDKAGGKFRPLFMSSNAITLSGKIQLVVRFYGEPDQIHANYDFVHCMSYWDSATRRVTLRQEALESILTRELKYIGSKYPICSMIRTRKFIARGWTINAGQFVKMAWQIAQLNLKDIAVLEDQLVGVDAAYFMQVIAMLRDAPNPSDIDGTYLMTVIDKLF